MALPAIQITLNTVRKIDPTRTLVLRGQFVAQVNKRFRDLKGAINQLLTKDNFLDPVKPTEYQSGIIPIGLAAKYEYLRSDVKVEQFMGWLKDQESQGILEIIQRPGGLRRGQSQAWSDTYIRSSYSKGIAQGRADLRVAGADIPSFQQIPGGVSTVFNQPFHADRVALCYTRCFNGMKGVTEAMNGYLSRELALGMAGGQSPYAIARRINEKVDKIGIVRARMIARTEIIQSHNEAALNEYERAEIEIGETVKVEWVATMDNRVRPHHAERDGKTYERSVAREMLGEPNCRCGLAPYVESLDKKKGKKAPAKKAVEKFVPTKTIEQAENWAKNNIREIKSVSFANFTTEQANSVLSELNLLQNKYGKLGSLESIEIKPITFPMAARMDMGKTLQIRQDMTDTILARLTDSKIDLSKPGLAGLIDHEIGHAMTPDIFHVEKGKTTFTKFGQKLDDFFEKNKDRIKKGLTPYAATARHEFVAEAFAFREAGNAPAWVLKWLKDEGI